MRIARYLARCGIASRRKAEELVLAGRVTVNGAVATDLGRQIDPASDDVRLGNRRLVLAPEHVTLLLNKPPGVLVSRGDTHGRRTVYGLLPERYRALESRLIYVGRLDFQSEGLLLLTTDGELANRLAHPSHHAEKEYHVWTNVGLGEEELGQLRLGVELEDGAARAVVAESVGEPEAMVYRVVLLEGRKRQVRRMIEAVGARVTRLVRVRMGALELGALASGEWRELTPKELDALLRVT